MPSALTGLPIRRSSRALTPTRDFGVSIPLPATGRSGSRPARTGPHPSRFLPRWTHRGGPASTPSRNTGAVLSWPRSPRPPERSLSSQHISRTNCCRHPTGVRSSIERVGEEWPSTHTPVTMRQVPGLSAWSTACGYGRSARPALRTGTPTQAGIFGDMGRAARYRVNTARIALIRA